MIREVTDSDEEHQEHRRSWLDEPVVGEALAFVERQLEERPYVTLAAAAGAGVVLGGGVPDWALRMAWKHGGSRWLSGALAPVVIGAVDRALRPDPASD